MDDLNNEINKEIKNSVDKVLNITSNIKRKNKTKTLKSKSEFNTLILSLEAIVVRSESLLIGFGLDNSKYDELFFNAIDALLSLVYSKESIELIWFYIYDRIDEEGNIIPISNGEQDIYINDVNTLWEIIQSIEDSKKK